MKLYVWPLFRFPITYSAYFSSKFDSSFDIGFKRKKPKVAKMEKCCWTIIIFNKTGAGGSRRFLAVVWWCHRCSSLFISSYQCTAIRTPKDINLCLLSFSKIITFYTVKGFISIRMFGKKGSSYLPIFVFDWGFLSYAISVGHIKDLYSSTIQILGNIYNPMQLLYGWDKLCYNLTW